MLVASSPKDSATARAAFIRSQQQHLSSVTAVASVKKPAQRDKQVCRPSFLVINCPILLFCWGAIYKKKNFLKNFLKNLLKVFLKLITLRK